MVAVEDLSLQLYTVRHLLEEDFDATMARIAALGYRQVEPFGLVGSADRLAEALPRYGLTAPTTHAGLLGEDTGRVSPPPGSSASPRSSTRTSTPSAGGPPTTSGPRRGP
jgi:hypothetical protein